MTGAAPAQILLHDAVHHRRVFALELECRREHEVLAVVEGRVVVPELHVRTVNRPALALFCQELRRPEHFGNEHRPLALGGGREEMQILPDRAANGARNADVVLEPGPPAANRLRNELRHHGATLDPELSVLAKREVRGDVSDHQTANALVGDQHVRAQTEDEIRNLGLASG